MPKGIFTKNLQDLTKKNELHSNEELHPSNINNGELPISILSFKPELNCFGYVFLKEKNGNWSTIKISFDEALTTTEFSDKEYAGTDKQMAIERLKIKLGEKVF